ncbi:GNAT family N-acetyltransferase [Microbacterium sp. cx-59]|uniref:GNAT family N-acetyltransferase n=1 Tax=Microbacterium sp. cx-59 TaxID=2891207 RepID=UPI001E347B30|nr:GNAT family N-acetyltransferase [Microbacterium sp. cx-59]MCC4907279.1 GNAT family N-acetyltransferase [Microbacterium sp. cx-59]
MRHPHSLTFTVADPASLEGRAILTRFFEDLVASYWGRPATSAEVTRAMRNEPSDDLRDGTGFFLLIRDDDRIIGCGGVRLIDETTGEVTRVFVAPEARGSGAGRALLQQLESASAQRGLRRLRLTVREDLTPARSLYEACGYGAVESFSTSPYADHFLAKTIGTSEPQA